MEFSKTIFQAWKVVEIAYITESHAKVVDNDCKVTELFTQMINCNVKTND